MSAPTTPDTAPSPHGAASAREADPLVSRAFVPGLSDDAETVRDLPNILTELNRVKCLFQLRAISSVLGLDPLHHEPRQPSDSYGAALSLGGGKSFHEVAP